MAYYQPCRKCTITRIVLFMCISLFLMVLMCLQIPKTVNLAQKIPSPLMLGGIIVVGGTLEFVRRYLVMKRDKEMVSSTAASLDQ